MAILLKITLCIISSIFFIPRIECSTTSKERDEIRDDHVSSEASPVLNLRKEQHLDNFVAPKPKRKVVATPSRATEKSIQNPKSTEELLESFYNDQGGAQLFPDHYKDALEALLYGQDEVASGDFDAARKRVVSIFEQMPLFDNIWNRNADIFGLSVGNPIAYYGLRMLDFITQVGDVPTKGTLRMTAVVAQCAIVSRPTLPDFEPETVILDIDPKILEDSYRRLHVSTDLFRYWVKAITGGYEVELVVSLMEECTTKVTYTDNGSIIVSYPDTGHMIESVPSEIYDKTNFWWVVAPSGVPGDGRGYDRHWITGGMGGSSGQPVFLSDDKWFTRKVEHIGTGPYSEIETRAYQPEWFQHEFMHFLYGKWSEFGLEDSSHQWFDRSTWPDDFIGKWEPDYYAESITKRLLSATPSLAEVFQIRNPRPVSLGNINLDDIVGDYERRPILNDWHSVTISKISESKLLWRNAAGVEWSLLKQDQMLISSGSPYEDMEIMLKVVDGMVQGVYFFDLYQSLTNAPVPTRLPTNLPTLSSLPTISSCRNSFTSFFNSFLMMQDIF